MPMRHAFSLFLTSVKSIIYWSEKKKKKKINKCWKPKILYVRIHVWIYKIIPSECLIGIEQRTERGQIKTWFKNYEKTLFNTIYPAKAAAAAAATVLWQQIPCFLANNRHDRIKKSHEMDTDRIQRKIFYKWDFMHTRSVEWLPT